LDGLKHLVNAGDYQAKLENEIERLEQGDITSAGWKYSWNIGVGALINCHVVVRSGKQSLEQCRQERRNL
jgi:hypothetical protein